MRAASAARASALEADRTRHWGTSRVAAGAGAVSCSTMTWALVPPMPKLLTAATRWRPWGQGMACAGTWKGGIGADLRVEGGRSRAVGGSVPWCTASTARTRPTTPAAAPRWPIWLLTELRAQRPDSLTSERLAQRGRFDRVAQPGTGAVGLHIAEVGAGTAAAGQGGADHRAAVRPGTARCNSSSPHRRC